MTKNCSHCGHELDYDKRCWRCENKAESAYYSTLYRCINSNCIAIGSKLKVTDGDEDSLELCCQWCKQKFTIDISIEEPDWDTPTAKDDQDMINEYHLRKYGEC